MSAMQSAEMQSQSVSFQEGDNMPEHDDSVTESGKDSS